MQAPGVSRVGIKGGLSRFIKRVGYSFLQVQKKGNLPISSGPGKAQSLDKLHFRKRANFG